MRNDDRLHVLFVRKKYTDLMLNDNTVLKGYFTYYKNNY